VQDGQTLDVPFSFEEPEYTYDTGFVKAPASAPNLTPDHQDSWLWPVAGVFTLTSVILVIWSRRKSKVHRTNELVKPPKS
jgi:hypothetical protein